ERDWIHRSAEPVVESGLEQMNLMMERYSVHCCAAKRTRGKTAVAGVDIEIFRFGRPVAAEFRLDTAARGPSGSRIRLDSRHSTQVETASESIFNAHEGNATGGIDHRRAGDIAKPSADCAAPAGLDAHNVGIIEILERMLG